MAGLLKIDCELEHLPGRPALSLIKAEPRSRDTAAA
jgi:hypothetical protein